jgi:hypothetical protein
MRPSVFLLTAALPLSACAPTDELRSVNAMGGFTTDNVMKIHSGMKSNEILEMFGAPKDVSQSVCGENVGKPWNCTTWEYGDSFYDRASFTFSGDSGSLVLNDFNIRRK